MAVLRTLRTVFKADTKQFRKNVKAARRSVKNWASGIKNLVGRIGKLGGLLTGVGGVGLAVWLRSEARAIDQSQKWAQRLGITTEAMTSLEHAAEISGVRVEQLRMGMQRLGRRVGEAAEGVGEAQMALKQLGIDAVALNELPLDEQLKVIAERVNALGNQGTKLARTFKLVDSEGVGLINLFRLGRKGIEQLQADAKALGIAVTDEMADKVVRANDALTRMGAALRGVARTIVIEMSPVVEELGNMFADKIGQGAQSMKGLVLNAFEEMTVGLVNFLNRLLRVPRLMEQVAAGHGGDLAAVFAQETNIEADIRNFFARLKLSKPGAGGGGVAGDSTTNAAVTAAETFGKRAGSVVQSTLSSSITQGVFNGFANADAAIRQFGERVFGVIVDAFTRAAIGRPAEQFFTSAFNTFAPSIDLERGRTK